MKIFYVSYSEGTQYKVYTDAKTVASDVIYSGNLSDSGNKKNAGYGNDNAKLEMKVTASEITRSKTMTLTATD